VHGSRGPPRSRLIITPFLDLLDGADAGLLEGLVVEFAAVVRMPVFGQKADWKSTIYNLFGM
jgi:hypothetical protein